MKIFGWTNPVYDVKSLFKTISLLLDFASILIAIQMFLKLVIHWFM